MVKKFLSNLLLLLFANLLVKPLWILGVERAVQNRAGTEAYGNYYILFNFSFLFSIVLDLGINNYNSKIAAQQPELLNRNFSGMMVLKLLFSAFFVLLTLLLGWLSGYQAHDMGMLALLCLNQVIAYYILYMRSNLSGLHLFKTDTLVSVLDRLFMIIICTWLLYLRTGNDFRMEYFVYAQCISYSLAALICFALLKPRLGKVQFSWNRALFTDIIKKSYPYALLAFLMVVYTRIDTSMLKLLLPDSAYHAGVYASAYRLLDAANTLGILSASLLLPIFLRMIATRESLDKLLGFSFPLIVWPACILAACSWVYRHELMEMLYAENSPYAEQVFFILMISFIPICCIYVFGTLLTASEKLSFLNKVAAASLVLNIGLNLWLIPRYMALGAALSGLLTQSFVAFMHYRECYRSLPVTHSATLLFKVLLLALFTLASAWLSSYLLPGRWLEGILLCCAGSIFVALALNIFRLKEQWPLLLGLFQRANTPDN